MCHSAPRGRWWKLWNEEVKALEVLKRPVLLLLSPPQTDTLGAVHAHAHAHKLTHTGREKARSR